MMVVCLLLGVVASGQASGQDEGWMVRPARPTVGDTVWLERRFPLPAGWRLRPGRITGSGAVESLGEPIIARRGADWIVRYPVTAWAPGSQAVTLPAVWRLGPDGQADSLAGGTAAFELYSVIPDSVTAPAPRPALAPLRPWRRDPQSVLLATLGAGAALGLAWWWRRRPTRRHVPPAPAPSAAAVADARWLDAGEPKAVAARAAGGLRAALARAVPEAHAGLSTAECLAKLQLHRPQAPVRDVAAVLEALDHVAFATEAGPDVAALARRARALAEGLKR
ncbi:MAG: hypothetical protein ACREMW_13655 [Gemmatimonadales bacterium]